MDKLLFKRIDNTGLVLFRMTFGFLLACEGFGAIATGWVRRVFVAPDFTFNFIGLDFLQVFTNEWMYVHFVLMGICGLLIMVGYKYRIAMIGYATLWTLAYLSQKTSYNNHYYLMVLLCWIMVFLPANRAASVDAKMNPSIHSTSMPRWVLLFMILQIWIVYTYASIAKIYPDWLDATTPGLFMRGKADYWLIGDFLQQEWVHYSIAYVGILFDLLIVPLFLWRKTRMFAFVVSLFFHLFNSAVFLIGIFPYMSISFAFLFFSSETLQKRFLPKKEIYKGDEVIVPNYKPLLIGLASIYFLIQIGLPLRHWFIQDDVLWTEEGHRLSWRMMLRTKNGTLTVWTVDKATGERTRYNTREILSKKQQRTVKTKADLLWQLAQKIKEIEADKGKDVQVFMDARVSVNGGQFKRFIDPKVDLASVPWEPFKHHEWILPSPEVYNVKKD